MMLGKNGAFSTLDKIISIMGRTWQTPFATTRVASLAAAGYPPVVSLSVPDHLGSQYVPLSKTQK
jgi:hypothetical protein